MLDFEDFYKISNKCFLLIGIDLNPIVPTTKWEKLKVKLVKINYWSNPINLCIAMILTILHIVINGGGLVGTGPAWSILFLLVIAMAKTLHLMLKLKDILAFKDKLKILFDQSYFWHYDRHMRNLKVNNIMINIYFWMVHVTSAAFLAMPLFECLIVHLNGNEKWEKSLPHQLYIPIDYDSIPVYAAIYLWFIIASFATNNYMVCNEVFFDTLLVNLAAEFDNLGDDFEEFDYKNFIDAEFKKLVNRHNRLLELRSEMDSIYNLPVMITFLGSTGLLCFSLLLFFMQDFTLANVMNLMKFGSYLGATTIQIFLMSYFCQKLKTSSGNIEKKIYESNWYEADKKVIRSVQMVLLKAQQSVELTALSFFGVDLTLVTNVLSTAHSYFSVLKSFYKQ